MDIKFYLRSSLYEESNRKWCRSAGLAHSTFATRCNWQQVIWGQVHATGTRNTLDCNQSNYFSRIISPTYLLNLVQLEIAPFDPPTPKTLS